MEGYGKESEIKWLPLSLYGASFLRYLMKDYGYNLDEGFVLITDGERQARKFITEYCMRTKGNGVKVTDMKRCNFENYQCGLLNLQRGRREEQVINFLESDGFMPVVLVGGLLPEYLSDRFVFRLKQADVENVSTKEFADQIAGFYSFVTQNVTDVCNVLEELESSIEFMEYSGDGNEKTIFAIFTVVGKIYSLYLRQNHTERYVVDFFQNYIVETKERLQKIKEFASGEEMAESISSLIWEYMEENPDVYLIDVEKIDGCGYNALKANNAFLYDSQFYLFPPRLFMKICEPLLQTVSEPGLKRRMKEEGILHCNSSDYTVKKEIVNVYGARERFRMLWICKQALIFPDNLILEYVFADETINTEHEEV